MDKDERLALRILSLIIIVGSIYLGITETFNITETICAILTGTGLNYISRRGYKYVK